MNARQMVIRAMKWVSVATDPIGGKRPGPRVLIYHQVGAGSGLEMDVSTDAFRSQVDWLSNHGEIVGLTEALDRLRDEELADDLYVITFDDGHMGVYLHAFPHLEKNSIPFTLYLTTEPLEGGGYLHGDRLMPTLSWSHVEEMMSTGLVTIGSHSHRHLDARRYDAPSIKADLAICDDILAERTGSKPRHYAYPWGRWSGLADPIVRDRYQTAVLGSGRGLRAAYDPHRIPRIPVMASDSPRLFTRKMWGGFRLETGLREARDRLSSG